MAQSYRSIQQTNYLGLTFDAKLTWKEPIKGQVLPHLTPKYTIQQHPTISDQQTKPFNYFPSVHM